MTVINLEAAIDDVCEWLDYGFSEPGVLESIRHLNSARIRALVERQRARRAGEAEYLSWILVTASPAAAASAEPIAGYVSVDDEGRGLFARQPSGIEGGPLHKWIPVVEKRHAD